jgi:hypothetical protein
LANCLFTDISDLLTNQIPHKMFSYHREYWSKVSGNTPEARREMCRRLERQEMKKAGVKQEKVVKPARNYFDKNGQPFSCNEPKLSFTLQDDMERNLLMLDLSVQR